VKKLTCRAKSQSPKKTIYKHPRAPQGWHPSLQRTARWEAGLQPLPRSPNYQRILQDTANAIGKVMMSLKNQSLTVLSQNKPLQKAAQEHRMVWQNHKAPSGMAPSQLAAHQGNGRGALVPFEC